MPKWMAFFSIILALSLVAGQMCIYIDNPNDENALKINQTGNTGDSPTKGGALHIDNTKNSGTAFSIFTDYEGPRQDGLFFIKVNNEKYDGPIVRIVSKSKDSEAQIRIDAPTPEIEMVETDQTSPSGKFEIRVQDNQFQVNSRADSDNTFERLLEIDQLRTNGRAKFYSGIRIGKRNEPNYLDITNEGKMSFLGNAGFFPKVIKQPDKPITNQMADGELLVWVDSNDDRAKMVFRQANKIYLL